MILDFCAHLRLTFLSPPLCHASTFCFSYLRQMAPFPGGIVIREREGKVVGAVGVSGASADEDEYCALAGVEAANLEGMFTEPVCHSLKEK
jgi:hypothetical protein